jgi:hypothetical protein
MKRRQDWVEGRKKARSGLVGKRRREIISVLYA